MQLTASSRSSPTRPSTTPPAPRSGTVEARLAGPGAGSAPPRASGICHSYAPDGRCISLLKILLTNFCIYDCLYCVNRVTSNVAARPLHGRGGRPADARLLPAQLHRGPVPQLGHHPLARLHDGAAGRGGARCCARSTTSAATSTSRRSPKRAPSCWPSAGRYADRLSINIELPTDAEPGGAGAREGRRGDPPLDGAPARAHRRREERRDARTRSQSRRAAAAGFAPAGQSTQMIVGADATADGDDPRDQRARSTAPIGCGASTTPRSARSRTPRARCRCRRRRWCASTGSTRPTG